MRPLLTRWGLVGLGAAADAVDDVGGGRTQFAQPVARPGELQAEHAETERHDHDRRAGQHDHRDANQQDGAADHGYDDPACPAVSDRAPEPGAQPSSHFAPSLAIARSCTRDNVRTATTAPQPARNMSHCVSQTSPWVDRKSSAATPAATATHHSRNSYIALIARQVMMVMKLSQPPPFT